MKDLLALAKKSKAIQIKNPSKTLKNRCLTLKKNVNAARVEFIKEEFKEYDLVINNSFEIPTPNDGENNRVPFSIEDLCLKIARHEKENGIRTQLGFLTEEDHSRDVKRFFSSLKSKFHITTKEWERFKRLFRGYGQG